VARDKGGRPDAVLAAARHYDVVVEVGIVTAIVHLLAVGQIIRLVLHRPHNESPTLKPAASQYRLS